MYACEYFFTKQIFLLDFYAYVKLLNLFLNNFNEKLVKKNKFVKKKHIFFKTLRKCQIKRHSTLVSLIYLFLDDSLLSYKQ